MQYVRILALNFEDVFQQRMRAFVWFTTQLVNPIILILFWKGAFSRNTTIGGWTRSELNTYYLLLVVVTSCLISHIQTKIARDDIRDGGLVRYIIRPFPYLLFNFFGELPNRILLGVYGIIAFMILSHFVDHSLIHISTENVPITVTIIVLAYILSFISQSTLGFIAFWTTEISGIIDTVEVVRVVLAGIIVPLALFPNWLAHIATTLPFSYMVYFPLLSLQGKLPLQTQLLVILMQVCWIAIFSFLYTVLWNQGLKKFSGIGQ